MVTITKEMKDNRKSILEVAEEIIDLAILNAVDKGENKCEFPCDPESSEYIEINGRRVYVDWEDYYNELVSMYEDNGYTIKHDGYPVYGGRWVDKWYICW